MLVHETQSAIVFSKICVYICIEPVFFCVFFPSFSAIACCVKLVVVILYCTYR